jgi:hypothetical protein
MRHFNGRRWSEYVTALVCPDFQSFGDVVRTRILPVFDNMHDEASEVRERFFRERGARVHASEDVDPWDLWSDIADKATDAGFEHYEMLWSMKFATLNLFSAALYHLTEQHVIDLVVMMRDSHQRDELSSDDAIAWLKGTLTSTSSGYASGVSFTNSSS